MSPGAFHSSRLNTGLHNTFFHSGWQNDTVKLKEKEIQAGEQNSVQPVSEVTLHEAMCVNGNCTQSETRQGIINSLNKRYKTITRELVLSIWTSVHMGLCGCVVRYAWLASYSSCLMY